jgi:hypothetical protein
MTRESAAVTDDGRLHFRTKVLASGHALVAVHATARVPADADALSNFESLGIGPTAVTWPMTSWPRIAGY